jgi:hypothetical protein
MATIDRPVLVLLAAAAMLGVGGCSAERIAPSVAAPAQDMARTPATPPSTAPSAPAAPSAAPAAPSTAGGRLAAVDPGEIRVVMVDLNLAQALDRCGFPALGSFMRDYTQKRIDSCPNSAERKAALRAVMESAALREMRQADEARANGETLQCYASDKLVVIKEMIPIAQRIVARAEKPMDCGDISSAER